MRLTLRALMMVAGLAVCLPFHYLWRLFGQKSPWPRRFLFWVGWSAGMRVHVTGRPLCSHVLIVSNHLSWLDIMIIAGASGAAFVSKDDVARWPVFGWLAGLNDTVFVARADRRNVHNQAAAVRRALATGRPIALFPEGTTEGGRAILPFRASLFAALAPPLPHVMVQPVAIDYGGAAHDIAWVGKESAGANAKRVLSRPGTARVDLHFLPPIDPADFPDRKALAEAARGSIVRALDASAAHALGL